MQENIQEKTEERLTLHTVEELGKLYLELKKSIDLSNWNDTVENINRNFHLGNNTAWSTTFLNPEQIEELYKAGYRVTESLGNNCHKITW